MSNSIFTRENESTVYAIIVATVILGIIIVLALYRILGG